MIKDIFLHINKSNLEHIEFLENKITELETKLNEQIAENILLNHKLYMSKTKTK